MSSAAAVDAEWAIVRIWLASEASVLHFKRPGGVRCISNFGAEPIALPDGDVLLSSVQLADGRLPSDATDWLRMR